MSVARLQKAVNLYTGTARFSPLTVTGTFDGETRQGVAFVAKYLYALRQEGRIIAVGLTDQVLLALAGDERWLADLHDSYFGYVAEQYELAARALGLRLQASAPGSSLLWWGLALAGGLWAVNRYVIGEK